MHLKLDSGREARLDRHLLWLRCRADSIVRDAEVVRRALVPKDTLGGRWTILGQSFGGFCCLTYLSIAPQGDVIDGNYTPLPPASGRSRLLSPSNTDLNCRCSTRSVTKITTDWDLVHLQAWWRCC